MGIPTNPSFELAHLGHVEVLTDKFDESLDFFTRVHGSKLSALEGDSAYLRAWEDHEFCTLNGAANLWDSTDHADIRARLILTLARAEIACVDRTPVPTAQV